MQELSIQATSNSPKITYTKELNTLSFEGDSFPENPFEFYKPVLIWIKKFFKNMESPLIITLDVNYINSNSSVVYLDVFDILEEEKNKGRDIQIQWIYNSNSEYALETAEELQEDYASLNIKFIEK